MASDSPLELIYQAHQLLSRMESAPRDYGGGRPLFASEIHTLCMIAEHPGINLTQLADCLNVSKSAVSKVVSKLMSSEYSEKRLADSNRKEVYFFVTARGKRAVQSHRQFHERVFGPLYQREAELGSKERECIAGFLADLGAMLQGHD